MYAYRVNVRVNVELESANRVGNSRSSGGSRPIIARFKAFRDRQTCLKSSAKLKGTQIYLNDDVSKATMEIRREKMGELREKRRLGFHAYFSGSEIIARKVRTKPSVGSQMSPPRGPAVGSPLLSPTKTGEVSSSPSPRRSGAGSTDQSSARDLREPLSSPVRRPSGVSSPSALAGPEAGGQAAGRTVIPRAVKGVIKY